MGGRYTPRCVAHPGCTEVGSMDGTHPMVYHRCIRYRCVDGGWCGRCGQRVVRAEGSVGGAGGGWFGRCGWRVVWAVREEGSVGDAGGGSGAVLTTSATDTPVQMLRCGGILTSGGMGPTNAAHYNNNNSRYIKVFTFSSASTPAVCYSDVYTDTIIPHIIKSN